MDNGACSYRRFLDGDEHAFDEIVESLFRGLVYFVDRIVHDMHAAEDIAMDALADLIVYRHRYNFKVSLKTYVYMLARHRALDYLRRRRVRPVAGQGESDVPDDEEDLEQIVLTDERKRVVNAALSHLREDMRQVVHLVYFEDMTYDEAARVMNKSKKQIDNLLYRAKNELREILGEEGKQWL